MITQSHTQCGATLNLSNAFSAATILHTRANSLFTNAAIPIILIVGILGNFAFVFTVFRVSSMRTITNAYLVNMAVADIIFVSTSVVTIIGYYASPVANDTFASWVGCTIAWGLPYMLYFTSLLSVCFVTVERYFAICRPLQHRIVTGKTRTRRLILSSWVCGILLGICVTPAHGNLVSYCVIWPDMVEYASFPITIQYCIPFQNAAANIFAQTVQFLPFIVATVGNFFMYQRILAVLGNRPGSYADNGVIQANGIINQAKFTLIRKQVARLLIINVIIFFVCQAPFRLINIQIISLYTVGYGIFNAAQFEILIPVGRTLVMVNSCTNVFVYLLTSSFYRRGFCSAFGFRSSPFSNTTDNSTNTVTQMNLSQIVLDTSNLKV